MITSMCLFVSNRCKRIRKKQKIADLYMEALMVGKNSGCEIGRENGNNN